MDFYHGNIPILEQSVAADRDTLFPAGQSFGLVPRDYSVEPEAMFAPPGDMQLVPRSEWDARFDEQEATQSSLEHMFLSGPNSAPAFVNLDQNGDGDCWAYSTGHAMMLSWLKQGGFVPRLNPHFVATYLKRFNGGWCGASAKVVREVGCVTQGTGPTEWPLHSHNTSLLNQARLDAAAKHKVTEDWCDLTREIWNQQMTAAQLATCGFMNIPAPSDFNWWAHSVCQVRWVRIEAGSWGPLILNSWLGWGRHGLAVLRGSQATANGAVAMRSTTPTTP
jgi:hypothetical protein